MSPVLLPTAFTMQYQQNWQYPAQADQFAPTDIFVSYTAYGAPGYEPAPSYAAPNHLSAAYSYALQCGAAQMVGPGWLSFDASSAVAIRPAFAIPGYPKTSYINHPPKVPAPTHLFPGATTTAIGGADRGAADRQPSGHNRNNGERPLPMKANSSAPFALPPLVASAARDGGDHDGQRALARPSFACDGIGLAPPTSAPGFTDGGQDGQSLVPIPIPSAGTETAHLGNKASSHKWGPVQQLPDTALNWHGRVCSDCGTVQYYGRAWGSIKHKGYSKVVSPCRGGGGIGEATSAPELASLIVPSAGIAQDGEPPMTFSKRAMKRLRQDELANASAVSTVPISAGVGTPPPPPPLAY